MKKRKEQQQQQQRGISFTHERNKLAHLIQEQINNLNNESRI